MFQPTTLSCKSSSNALYHMLYVCQSPMGQRSPPGARPSGRGFLRGIAHDPTELAGWGAILARPGEVVTRYVRRRP
jgi:hypothetical protein